MNSSKAAFWPAPNKTQKYISANTARVNEVRVQLMDLDISRTNKLKFCNRQLKNLATYSAEVTNLNSVISKRTVQAGFNLCHR